MTFAVSAWSKPYVGAPFRRFGGDLKTGIDCWNLLRRVYREVFGIDLPEFAIDAADLRKVAGAISANKSANWVEVNRPMLKDGDGVLMFGHVGERLARAETHVGIFVAPRHVLHVEETTASVVVPLGHGSIDYRLAGFYRHRTRVTA